MRCTTDSQRQRDYLIAGYAALAAAIHVLEAGLPTPIPGIKPGLANLVTLVVLCRHGWRAAAAVALLRIVLSGLVLGTLFAPTFWLSLSGGLSALLALFLATAWGHSLPRFAPGPVGMSLLAACAHIHGQFWLAWAWFIPHPSLLSLLPLLHGFAMVLGLITGLLTARVLKAMQEMESGAPQ